MPSWDDPTYATPEDVADEAEEDLEDLAPDARKLAWGTDGAIPAGSSVLSSALVDFEAQGVAAGDLVLVDPDPDLVSGAAGRAAFGPSGETFVADAVSGHDLTLRRPGMASGTGAAANPTASALAGVLFLVPGLTTLLEKASDRIRSRLDSDGTADLITADERRDAAVWRLLATRYRALWAKSISSGQSGSAGDIWGDKADRYEALLEALLSGLSQRRSTGSAASAIAVVPLDP